MALDLSVATRRALEELSIEPNIVVKFDGIETVFSAKPVNDFITYGYPDIFYGDPNLFYGGLIEIEGNEPLIDSQSTTYSIRQQMNYDVAQASSISSMTVGLVDKDQLITELITPGNTVEDILGRRADIYITFGEVSFFEDSILVFRGFVTSIDSGSGIVKFKINHPDNKKKVKLFKTVETKLNGSINASDTVIGVDDTSNFLEPSGPLSTYIRIGNELIEYTGISGNSFTGCTRGVLGTSPSPHSNDAQVRVLYALEGNPIDLALQIMMSGFGTDPVHEGIAVTSFLKVGAGNTQVANAIYFDQINIPQEYGLRVGDTIDISGATNGANNFTGRTVTDVVQFESGFYVVVNGAALVLEDTTSAVMDTFTQFNVLGDGMRMSPAEVDVDEHIRIRDFFHSATEFRVYIKEDEIDGKEFIAEQLFKPIACYELPRKAQSSIGFTVGPIPGQNIVTLNDTNIKDPRSVKITRTTNRAFYNEVVYKYDDDPLETSEKFQTGNITISQTSKNRIPGTTKTFEIPSLGLRTDLNAQNIVASNSQRIIDRYQFGAELVTLRALLRDGAAVEIGDVVVGDFGNIKVSDITEGSREFKPRLFEVQNKTTNLKTGDVEFVLLDTGLNIDTRFGLISPYSPIAGVVSQSQFVIGLDALYPSRFGEDEYRKWLGLVSVGNPISVRVRNEDYTVDEDLVVQNIDGNTFTLQDAATITLAPGLIVEFTGYDDIDTSDKQKLIYGYMTDAANFADGGFPYSMI